MRHLLPAILAMGSVVVASNVLVQFRLGEFLTWGALTYPFAFLVTDITNRVNGAAAARRVVLAGFAVGLACSLIAAGLGTTTVRIAVASGAAFLCAQMVDVAIFERLRHRGWWQAPFLSSLVGSALERRGVLTLRGRRALMRRRRARVLGLCVPTFLLLAVPFVGVVVFPVATAAGTLLARQLTGESTTEAAAERPTG